MNASSDLQFVEPPAADAGAAESQPIGLTAWATRAAVRGATALYLRAGAAPLARVDDRLEPLTADAVDNWRFEELVDRVQQRPLQGLGAGIARRDDLAGAVGRTGELLVVHRRPGHAA